MSRKLGVGLLIGFGLAIVLLFGFRIAHEIRRWNSPPRPQPRATTTDVTLIQEWMTIPYIAHTYAVPDRALFDSLAIPEKENQKKSLLEINDEYFPEQDGFVIERLQAAIRSMQKGAPPPGPPSAPTVTAP